LVRRCFTFTHCLTLTSSIRNVAQVKVKCLAMLSCTQPSENVTEHQKTEERCVKKVSVAHEATREQLKNLSCNSSRRASKDLV